MLDTFCVEIDRARRPECELPNSAYRSCHAYHKELEKQYPSPAHTIIVNKAGSDYFRRHYGDATPGSARTSRR